MNDISPQEWASILKKLNNIPFLLKEIKERYTDHRRQELIHTQILADWEENENSEFERDVKRGACFLRIDKALNIEDKNPVPLSSLNSEQRIQECLSSIRELIIKPEDQYWEKVLQIAVTHATFLTAFKTVLSALNIDMTNIQWEMSGKYFSVKSIFSDRFSPAILEIIRHPKTKIIRKVNVTSKGSLDIASYNTVSNEISKVIIPEAITEKLKYSITFDKNNHPVVSDLHTQINVHPQ